MSVSPGFLNPGNNITGTMNSNGVVSSLHLLSITNSIHNNDLDATPLELKSYPCRNPGFENPGLEDESPLGFFNLSGFNSPPLAAIQGLETMKIPRLCKAKFEPEREGLPRGASFRETPRDMRNEVLVRRLLSTLYSLISGLCSLLSALCSLLSRSHTSMNLAYFKKQTKPTDI